jgi:hypothetical protein
MTSSMTGNQVAARALSLQCVFGSELWRRSIVAEDATVRAVSAVLTYGVSDEWLQLTRAACGALACARHFDKQNRPIEALPGAGN